MKVVLDENYLSHPKIRLVGEAIAWFNISALLFAHRNLTDGHIRPDDLTEIVEPLRRCGVVIADARRPTLFGSSAPIADVLDEVIERLTDAGLWDVSDHGWVIHDYADYQPTRAELFTSYEKEQERTFRERLRSRTRRDRGRRPRTATAVTDVVRGSSSGCETHQVSSVQRPLDVDKDQDPGESGGDSIGWFASQLRGSNTRTPAAIASVVRRHGLPDAALYAALEIVRERKPQNEPGYFIRCLEGFAKEGRYGVTA